MQLLYVVNLDVEGPDAFERVRDHVGGWLSDEQHPLDDGFLLDGGRQSLAPGRAGGRAIERTGESEVVRDGAKGLLVRVHQSDEAGGLQLTTRVTVVEQDGHTRFRAGIGRVATGDALVPVSSTPVYQPRVLRTLDMDEHLRLSVFGQTVQGRYLQIRNAAEALALNEALPTVKRLPTLLVHVRSPETWELARQTSRRLLGLVSTVTLNYATSRAVTAAFPHVRVPFGGMALLWPGLERTGYALDAEQINALGADSVLRHLSTLLGGLAALVHGRDRVWEAARGAADQIRLRALTERAENAQGRRDTQAELDALRGKIDVLEISSREWEEISEDAHQRADEADTRLKAADVEIQRLRAEVKSWRQAYEGVVATSDETETDPWAAIPPLKAKRSPSDTFDALTDAASDHIVFTENAHRSWASSPYPDPEDMTQKLTSLARAALDLYSRPPGQMPHLDDWFRSEHDLIVAMTDKAITEFKRKEMRWLHSFDFEEVHDLDGTPHVKVRDAVAPNKCGRIHFALDNANNRFVVHHVSVKAYNS
ncbi:hypothetical protein Q9R20_06280 [Microbacterium sp. PRF11]|uniref:hypothetical protein n=1 Tax=Microbacterium sp. PRF11 TaxID=2962593 RepID=UPI002880C3EA|nr:hypothetical protein [Microbacterium sp. PRF11]MDT0116594.1 hypothetical protein [Microbacterium sp. PRF11]